MRGLYIYFAGRAAGLALRAGNEGAMAHTRVLHCALSAQKEALS